MPTLAELKSSVIDGIYMGANPLPFTSYLLSIVSVVHRVPLVKYFFTDLIGTFTIFLVISQAISRLCLQGKYEKYNLYDFVVVSLFVIRKYQDVHSTLSGLMIFVTIRKLYSKNLLLTSIFLSLLTVTDSSFIPVIILISITQVWDFTQSMISPHVPIRKSLVKLFKLVVFVFVIPITFALAFIFADLSIRNSHSDVALKKSLEFQAGLRNFNIRNGTGKGHESGYKSETDLYVMDRSIIGLINYKYHSFFRLEKDIQATAENVTFCEIHKIHSKEFQDEEPRFIKNGDIVKFKSLTQPGFLGWQKKDGKEKFRNIFIDEFKEKEDFWVVETDGYLMARNSQVRFKSVKSNDYLCARKVKDLGSLSVSYTAEESCKIFYIPENTNHQYYKNTFQDPRAKETVVEFKRLSTSKMFIEHLKSINLKYNSYQLTLTNLGVLDFFAIFSLFVSLGAILIVFIAIFRCNKTVEISERTVITLVGLLLMMLSLPLIGLKFRAIQMLSFMFAGSLAEDLFKARKTIMVEPMKFNRKKHQ